YADLVRTNASRDRSVGEYELIDTGVFDDDDYVMVTSRWAKAAPDDMCLQIEVHNRSGREATLQVLPTVWFRNTWSWDPESGARPEMHADGGLLRGHHDRLGTFTVASRTVGSGGPQAGSAGPRL